MGVKAQKVRMDGKSVFMSNVPAPYQSLPGAARLACLATSHDNDHWWYGTIIRWPVHPHNQDGKT